MTDVDFAAWADENLTISAKNGYEWTAQCTNPSHDDGHPSMRVNVAKGLFYCHACGHKGKIGNGQITMPDYDFRKEIADVRARLVELAKPHRNRIKIKTMPESNLRRYRFDADWAKHRGYTDRTIRAFDLGYDPLFDTGTIPVRDPNGLLFGIIRRFLAPDHKGDRYKSPFGFRKSENLFASWLVSQTDNTTLVITEGPTDAMKVWQAGFPAVAVFGNAFNAAHLDGVVDLGITDVILMGDNDKGGRTLHKRATGRWFEEGTTRMTYKPDTDLRRVVNLREVKWPYDRTGHGGDPGGLSEKRIQWMIKRAVAVR